MSNEDKLDQIRRDVLDSMEMWDKASRCVFWAGAFFEVTLGAALLLLADYSNRGHVLIVLAAAAIYCPLVCFLIALACRADRNTERILKAIELLDVDDQRRSSPDDAGAAS